MKKWRDTIVGKCSDLSLVFNVLGGRNTSRHLMYSVFHDWEMNINKKFNIS
jgi:hypothetical protein